MNLNVKQVLTFGLFVASGVGFGVGIQNRRIAKLKAELDASEQKRMSEFASLYAIAMVEADRQIAEFNSFPVMPGMEEDAHELLRVLNAERRKLLSAETPDDVMARLATIRETVRHFLKIDV